MQRFRGGLVFKALRLLYHSTVGVRVIKKEEEEAEIDGFVSDSWREKSRRLPPVFSQECEAVPTRARIQGS